MAHIIKHVMSSATKIKLATLYIMWRETVYPKIILAKMGHPQPLTPLQTESSMAGGVVNGKNTPKRTKAMDMRFHWLIDREYQDQFRIYWRPGKLNYADYWTEHHQGKHHQNILRGFSHTTKRGGNVLIGRSAIFASYCSNINGKYIYNIQIHRTLMRVGWYGQ